MYYRFRQNNSGGSFDIDDKRGIGVVVYIEASSGNEANDIAEIKGIYYEGVYKGRDCDCCGDRWSPVHKLDGEWIPKFSEQYDWIWHDTCYVHLRDGRIVRVKKDDYSDPKVLEWRLKSA